MTSMSVNMNPQEIQEFEKLMREYISQNTYLNNAPKVDVNDPIPSFIAKTMAVADHQEAMYGPWNAMNLVDAVAKLKADYKITLDAVATDMVNELRRQERENFYSTSEFKCSQKNS